MSGIVFLVGVIAALIGLMGLANPETIGRVVQIWQGATRFWLAILARAVLGVIFLVVAPQCDVPILVQVIGCISLLAALVILVAGQERLDSMIDWWLSRPAKVIRASAMFALTFGALMIFAA